MKYLVVVDAQEDFVRGALKNDEALRKLPNLVEKIRQFNTNDEDPGMIICTKDTHNPHYLNTLEGKNLPVEHCIDGTAGWKLCKEIREALESKHFMYIYKPTFGSVKLLNFALENIKPEDSVEIAGYCTDICVVSNALLLRAACPNTPITVDASCCAGVTVEKHRAALETMKSCQITVINED